MLTHQALTPVEACPPFPSPGGSGGSTSIEDSLAAYLATHLNRRDFSFRQRPEELPHGWEAHVYRFQLQASNPLPSPFDSPLTLRAYATAHALPRARHEFAVLQHMRSIGYPTPRPILLEQDCQHFGGPFLILSWVPGQTLLDWLRARFTRILKVAHQLACLHAALHDLPADGLPISPGPFLDRRLAELDHMIQAYGLAALQPGLDWLTRHRPPEPSTPSILHLDFHPVNLIADSGFPRAVLDWSEADVGDRHADLAMTRVLIRASPVRTTRWSERLLARPARWWLARRYLRVYSRSFPVDRSRLRYYMAWAALRRLAMCGTWRKAGPWVHGFKSSARQYVLPEHERSLRQLFHQAAGLTLPIAD
jgi:aminoglycoside phosphotransferase (APT) family kinase protein